MIYKIKVSLNPISPDVYYEEKFVEADNQIAALEILTTKVHALGGHEKITIELVAETCLK